MAERWPAARTVESVVVDGQLIRIKVERRRGPRPSTTTWLAAARRTGRPLRELAFRAEAAWAEADGRGAPGGGVPARGPTTGGRRRGRRRTDGDEPA